MFTGPIPVGSTRTETGYTTADGEAVNPTAPFTHMIQYLEHLSQLSSWNLLE
jgi:hypothetical protein